MTYSSHNEPLKLIVPPLVLIRDRCGHDCRSIPFTHGMRIHQKIDIEEEGI
jgi:hypothetical protein